MSSSELAGSVVGIIVLIGVVVFGAMKCTANYSGASRDHATEQARAFANELGYTEAHVSCAGGDSDNDGYVSCTVAPLPKQGNPFSVRCTAAYTLQVDGCKLTPMVTGSINK